MRPNPFSGLPVVVKNLLIINAIVFLIQFTGLGIFSGRDLDNWFALHYFSSPLFKPWQLVTHIFMHRGPGHLVLNMLGLFMLAPPLEYKWGSQRFLTFYMLTGIGAALFYSGVHVVEYMNIVEGFSSSDIASFKAGGPAPIGLDTNRLVGFWVSNMVGASGAIYGVLLAFGMTYPNTELIMFPLPIPIKAKYFVLILGGMSIYNTLQNNPDDNVAHLAHLGGMIVGYVLIRLWRTRGGGNQFGWDR